MGSLLSRSKVTLFIAAMSVLLITAAVPLDAADLQPGYPDWTWDRVPVYLHFGSRTRLADEQVATAARLSNFICLEKAHGRLTDRDRPELVMREDVRRLRAANPKAKILMYWNTLIAWPFTSYNQRFAERHPEDWVLRDRATGAPLLKSMLGETPVYQYNLLNPQLRSWWVETCGDAVKQFGFDGLYMDAISQAKRPSLLKNGWGLDKSPSLDRAAIEMMQQVRTRMGRDRLLIFNGLRTRAGSIDQQTNGGSKYLAYADGAKIEHFDQFSSASKEDLVLYWRLAAAAARQGKIVIYKAYPDHDANWTNVDFMQRSQADREEFARAKITFPLACFLIGAEKHAYFCYGWGYDLEDGQLVDYPEYQRRLGPPKAKAERRGSGWIFTREFQHASVTVDLDRRQAQIAWNDDREPTPVTGQDQDQDQDQDKDKEAEFAAERRQVLELGKLVAPPKAYPAEGFAAEGNITPIFFEGLSWQGKPTRVFAWLGLPDTTHAAGADRQTPSNDKVPGIVLVHGGGGTAFKEWVKKWNARGFAAISIAVEGQTDEPADDGSRWKRHRWAGPARDGIYGDSDQPLTEQWMYHAVADTILANSLLRSLPQVDLNHVGVMGISWGGVITSTVIGIDDRFAFAIPTYGCGDLADAKNQYGRALGTNVLYRQVWDPLLRMRRVKMPTLWLSWTGDLHFPLDSLRSCYSEVAGPHMVALLPNMRHGHAPAWNPPDSYQFAESVVRNGKPWCRQLGVELDGMTARVNFSTANTVEKAVLVWTTEEGFTGHRKWTETTAGFQQIQDRVTVDVTLPMGTTAWFVNLHTRDLVASSDLEEAKSQ